MPDHQLRSMGWGAAAVGHKPAACNPPQAENQIDMQLREMGWGKPKPCDPPVSWLSVWGVVNCHVFAPGLRLRHTPMWVGTCLV